MNDRLASGIAVAALLGTLTGIALAPPAQRNELARRLSRGVRRLVHIVTHDRTRIAIAVELTATRIADVTRYVMDRIADGVAAAGSPAARIRYGVARHAGLRVRAISIDAIGDIILLQGVVADDAEWEALERIARTALPEGTIRNHVRVQRSTTAD